MGAAQGRRVRLRTSPHNSGLLFSGRMEKRILRFRHDETPTRILYFSRASPTGNRPLGGAHRDPSGAEGGLGRTAHLPLLR